jgi:hypothetical protein
VELYTGIDIELTGHLTTGTRTMRPDNRVAAGTAATNDFDQGLLQTIHRDDGEQFLRKQPLHRPYLLLVSVGRDGRGVVLPITAQVCRAQVPAPASHERTRKNTAVASRLVRLVISLTPHADTARLCPDKVINETRFF